MTRKITDTVEIEDGVVKMSGVYMPAYNINEWEAVVLKDEDYPLNINPKQQQEIDNFYVERYIEFEKLKELSKNFVDKYLVGSFQIEYNILEENNWCYFYDTYHEKLLQNLNIA